MENIISISNLNDFIFCPASIYFHLLDSETDRLSYQCSDQLNGSASHEKSDSHRYSSKVSVLQGCSVYSEKYNLLGKIGVFDIETGVLTERKRLVKHVYDGYVFQLYAQYFALTEMGYDVKELKIYSMSDNKMYEIKKPEENNEMFEKFEKTIIEVNDFSLEDFVQTNSEKCLHCIYEPLCIYSLKDRNDNR